jgi:ferredoxin
LPKISFQPANVTIEVAAGSNIRDAGITAGVEIPSTCGGVGSCGLCKVKITGGADVLGAMTALEVGKLGNVFFITKERLSCQTTVAGDVSCEIPDDTQAKMAKVLRQKEHGKQRILDRRAKSGR